MEFILLFSILVLFYIFAGYPVVICALSLLMNKKVGKKDCFPRVTLLISAYNEEKVIKEKLDNSLALDYPKDKLDIVVASESTDRTNEITAGYSDKGVVLYAYEGREGKRATLYKTVPLLKGDIIVFSDANSIYKADAVKKLVRNFADNRIGCVCGMLKYVNPGDVSIGKGESAYWEFDYILKKMASRTFSLGGSVNGSILAIRRELYDPIDKFRGDDYEISCRIEMEGYGVVLEPEAVAFEESSKTTGQEFKRKVRLSSWNFVSSIILMKEALKKKKPMTFFIIFSHRFLRYTTPIWLILLFISNLFVHEGIFGLILFLQMLFYCLAIFGMIVEKGRYKLNPVLLLPFYFCVMNYAALVGLLKNMSGKTEMLWEKTR